MADADTARLKKILAESYRNAAKDKRVKAAIRKRIADKKAQAAGETLDKETAHNLKTSLSGEAKAAAERKHTGAGKDKVLKPKPKPKKKKKKKVSLGVGQAGLNITQQKNRPKVEY